MAPVFTPRLFTSAILAMCPKTYMPLAHQASSCLTCSAQLSCGTAGAPGVEGVWVPLYQRLCALQALKSR